MIGFGGIAQVHKAAYAELEKEGKARLAAVCDTDPASFDKKIEINIGGGDKGENDFGAYTDLEEMLRCEHLDMIDICVPTYMHAETAAEMLRRGYDVLSEKPMALRYSECASMLEVAKSSGRRLMIGQCLHFFPEYEYLKGVVVSGEFGRPLSGFFQRLSTPPVWGWQNWYLDGARSGGCLQDMHIHDIDMTRWLFGDPDHVSCRSKSTVGDWDMAHSVLCFGEMTVTVIGDWSLPNVPFDASYRVAFERATVFCSGGRVTVVPAEGESWSPELPDVNGYAREIAYFIGLLLSGEENTVNLPEDAAASLRIIERLRESAVNGGERLAL